MIATVSRPGPDEDEILSHFGIDRSALLGAGGESRVFALDHDRVLRIFAGAVEDEGLTALIDLVNHLARGDIGVATSQVLDTGVIGAQQFTIDRRIPGESLGSWLSRPQPQQRRRRVLLDYLDVAGRLRHLPLPAPAEFRALLLPDRVAPGATLTQLLRAQAQIGIEHSDGKLAAALPNLGAQIERLFAELEDRQIEPAFVHADYFPGNVMIDGDHVSGVIDISVHALAADPVMDEVAAVCFLDQVGRADVTDDMAWLEAELADRLGDEAWLISAYRRWYALYYSMDHALIEWAAQQFGRPVPRQRSAR